MAVLLPMPPSVSVLRVVAAAHHSATQTGPQVDPVVTHGDTLVANGGTWFGDGGQIVEVVTGLSAHGLLDNTSSPQIAGYSYYSVVFGSDVGESLLYRSTHIDLGEMALVLL